MARPTTVLLAAVSILAIVAAGCAAKSDTSGPGTGSLSGSVAVSGSSTVLPISQLVAERFAGSNPEAQVSVDGPGTGDGFVLFCEGKTDINDASRPIESDEAKDCTKAGINYVELEIALDGITVMTNPANTAATCLNTGDLYALFGPESEGTSWSDANALAAEVGGTGNFPDQPLSIVAPGEESGTYDSFIDLAGIEDTALARGVPEGEAAALRTQNYQSSGNDSVIIQGIEGSDTALGFVGFAYADQQGENVTKLEIDGGEGCVAPNAEAIADGSYPLSRSLYIYVNTDTVATSETLRAFVDYYLSDPGIASVTDVDYVAIPPGRLDASRSAWAAAGGM